jgi:prefoldin subunit 5
LGIYSKVPFTPLAFFPGTIKHGNEITVLLGENYFVKRTAPQSREIASRRIKCEFLEFDLKRFVDIDTQINRLKSDIDQLKARLDFQETLEKKVN